MPENATLLSIERDPALRFPETCSVVVVILPVFAMVLVDNTPSTCKVLPIVTGALNVAGPRELNVPPLGTERLYIFYFYITFIQ